MLKKGGHSITKLERGTYMNENINLFLNLFKNLEMFLRVDNKEYNESTFFEKLNESNNVLIKNKKNMDLLKQAAKLRNILSHNNDIAEPTINFLKNFDILVNKIINPKRAFDIMIKYDQCLLAKPEDKILPIILKMKEGKNSSVPVVIDKKIIGIFNETSLFYAFINDKDEICVDLNHVKFNHHINNFKLDESIYFSYKFIPRDLSIFDCLQEFEIKPKNDMKLELLFVTEKGSSDESLLGLISIFDLINEIK